MNVGASNELYYSYDIGNWHFININTGAGNGSCGPFTGTGQGTTGPTCVDTSAQNDWLEADLASVPPTKGIAVLGHHPFFNSGTSHGGDSTSNLDDMLADAEAAQIDLYLAGHEHNYQRYRKQTLAGTASATGWRQFVVGTGGKSHNSLLSTKDAGYEFGNAADYGALKVTFTDTGYSWVFDPVTGSDIDPSTAEVPINGGVTNPPVETTFNSVADAYVSSGSPTTNYGSGVQLHAKSANPDRESYLRFDVTGLSGTVQDATLRLYASSVGVGDACLDEGIGADVHQVSNTTWSESTITWDTKPAHGTYESTEDDWLAATWVEWDVTGSVTGNGLRSYVVNIPSECVSVNGFTQFNSKEATSNDPELVITTG